ncbi:MAG: ThuA domain-containing protein [Salegentibacter sp.]
MGAMHPVSWYHTFDGGRAFYSALGHIPAIYENQWFLDHLSGGIYYAATGKGIKGE